MRISYLATPQQVMDYYICYHLDTIYYRQNHYEMSLSNMTTKGV